MNGKKSHDHVKRRIDLALSPAFKGRRMIGITTADIRAYTRTRLARRCSACDWQAQDAVDALAKVDAGALRDAATRIDTAAGTGSGTTGTGTAGSSDRQSA